MFASYKKIILFYKKINNKKGKFKKNWTENEIIGRQGKREFVCFKASKNMKNLNHLKNIFIKNGRSGKKNNKKGLSCKKKIINVPIKTKIIFNKQERILHREGKKLLIFNDNTIILLIKLKIEKIIKYKNFEIQNSKIIIIKLKKIYSFKRISKFIRKFKLKNLTILYNNYNNYKEKEAFYKKLLFFYNKKVILKQYLL